MSQPYQVATDMTIKSTSSCRSHRNNQIGHKLPLRRFLIINYELKVFALLLART